jgi:hypothetical protein
MSTKIQQIYPLIRVLNKQDFPGNKFLELPDLSTTADTRGQNRKCSGWLPLFRPPEVIKGSTFVNSRDLARVNLVTRVEAESNTSTMTLRVVGGDEKGSLDSETVKYGHEYQGTLT